MTARRSPERFDELSRRIAEAYAEVHETEGLVEIDAIVKVVRWEQPRRDHPGAQNR